MNELIKKLKEEIKEEIKKLEEENRNGAFNDLWIAANEETLEILEQKISPREIIKELKKKEKETKEMAINIIYKTTRIQIERRMKKDIQMEKIWEEVEKYVLDKFGPDAANRILVWETKKAIEYAIEMWKVVKNA